MGRTVLLAEAAYGWREWIRANRKESDLLVLDPSDANNGPAAHIRLFRGDRPIFDRFYGSLDPQKAPHLLIAAMVEALEFASSDVIVQLYPYRVTPVLRQTTQAILGVLKLEQIFVNQGFGGNFGVAYTPQELEPQLPNTVLAAQRRANWLAMIERCEEHTVDLSETILSGSRLGAGEPLGEARKTKLGLNKAYVESSGSTLYVVTDEEFSDETVSRALDFTGCSKAHFVTSAIYEGVLCAFSKLNGEDFGFGLIRSVDFINMRAHVLCTAIPPVPVPVLRLGSFRIDERGNEFGELKPWAL